MRKIVGYAIPCVLNKSFASPLPVDFEILSVMVVRGQPVLYGISDGGVIEKRERRFHLFGNEQEISEAVGVYVGSFVVNGKVPLHLFELEEPKPKLNLFRL